MQYFQYIHPPPTPFLDPHHQNPSRFFPHTFFFWPIKSSSWYLNTIDHVAIIQHTGTSKGHTFKENELPSPRRYQLSIAPQQGMRLPAHMFRDCVCLWLMRAAVTTMSSYMQLLCCIRRIGPCRHSMALTFMLTVLPLW